MSRPGFPEGVVVALVASLSASMLDSLINSVSSEVTAWRMLIAGLGFGYSVYLLCRSQQHVGRGIVVIGWLLFSLVAWLYALPVLAYALVTLMAVWLTRAVLFHNTVLAVLLDLGLTAVSLVFALWALLHTNNVLLCVWCLFLVQALCVTISSSRKPTLAYQTESSRQMIFLRALSTAQSALDRLARKTTD